MLNSRGGHMTEKRQPCVEERRDSTPESNIFYCPPPFNLDKSLLINICCCCFTLKIKIVFPPGVFFFQAAVTYFVKSTQNLTCNKVFYQKTYFLLLNACQKAGSRNALLRILTSPLPCCLHTSLDTHLNYFIIYEYESTGKHIARH